MSGRRYALQNEAGGVRRQLQSDSAGTLHRKMLSRSPESISPVLSGVTKRYFDTVRSLVRDALGNGLISTLTVLGRQRIKRVHRFLHIRRQPEMFPFNRLCPISICQREDRSTRTYLATCANL
jgi:hypothetical protein